MIGVFDGRTSESGSNNNVVGDGVNDIKKTTITAVINKSGKSRRRPLND